MHEGYGGHNRRRKRSLRVAPLARSQSLDAVSNTAPLRPEQRSSSNIARLNAFPRPRARTRCFESLQYTGPQHLPPLGRKGRRPSVVTHPVQLSNGKNSSRLALGGSSFPNPASGPADWSSREPAVLPAPEWTALSDVFVQAGQAAGIAFQWKEAQPINPTTPHEAGGATKVDGLAVVGVAENGLAARHGGISPGMVLVEVSGKRMIGMNQDQVMLLMREVASQSRVLSLARVAPRSPPSPSPRAFDLSTDSSEAITFRRENTTHTSEGSKCLAPSFSSAAFGLAGGGGKQMAAGSAAGSRPQSSSESSQASSRPQSSCLSFVVNNDADESLAASNGSAFSSPLYSARNREQGSTGPPETSSTRSSCHRHHLPSSSPPQRLIALRFVGSGGDMTLFDRDHILGLKTRDIEFAPSSNNIGGDGSLTLQTAEKHHRKNSHRSLQELTRDWKNDPFSTPARRRRLINDVCKVIVRSYTHAASWRVTELRREDKFITRIQAAFRMRSARRLFREKLAGRRAKAASVLQLGWLTSTARRRARVLREERYHDRRLEEAKRRKREVLERRERHRLEEEERQREADMRERETRRRRELGLVVFAQRRFRAQQEERRRLVQQAERLRENQQRQEKELLRAVSFTQAAFRYRLQRRRRKTHAQQQGTRGTIMKESAARACLQRAWRRHKADQELDRRRRRRQSGASVSMKIADDGNPAEKHAPGDHHPHPLVGSSERSDKDDHGPSGDREARANDEGLNWQSWSSAFGLNPALAAEIAREGEDTAVESTRPWTAAGAVQPSASKPPRARPDHPRPPPAGMMTVTVRRGSEETILVTPIVLTEKGEEGDGATATLPPAEPSVSGGVTIAARPNSPSKGGDSSGESRPIAVSATETGDDAGSAKPPSAVDGRSPAAADIHTNKPAAKGGTTEEQESRRGVSAEATPPPSNTRTPFFTPQINTKEATAAGLGLPLPPSTAAVANHGAAMTSLTDHTLTETTTTAPVAKTAASQRGSLTEGAAQIADSGRHASRTVVKPTEQLFMEDTQVYLGCAACGVKYLVEAVEPEPSRSTQAGQPAPEILYLCTTCGGTLRNNGEDGRWRRRRRPNSAPAAGRRRGGIGVFGGAGGVGSTGEKTLSGNEPPPAGVSPESLPSPRQPLRVYGEGRRGGGAARLRYAHCARIIQHAYQDFRHRQYLRDWATSQLRRWLVRRMHVRRRAVRRQVQSLAAVIIQSAARAASARARCSALRDTRLYRWMDRVVALYADTSGHGVGEGGYAPSPEAVDFLRDNDIPTPPPPPADPPPVPSPQKCAATYAAARKSVGTRNAPSRGGRALAEALAPRMGGPPPGCPAALDVDWGEWGVGLRLVFPPSPRVG